MDKIILDSQYFPSIGYVALIQQASVVAINDTELFNKQSYRNRCSILGANGKLDLIVPVDHHSTRKIRGLKLNYAERWTSIHKKSIESAYRKSPFFEHYEEELLNIFSTSHDRLIDLNSAILTTILETLEIDTKIISLSDLEKEKTLEFENLTEHIHPKRPKIKALHNDYQQVFNTETSKNLSVIDAIFCIGPETELLLQETTYIK